MQHVSANTCHSSFAYRKMQQQQISERICAGARHGFGAGRWKGALVAVKVIDHRVKGNGNAVDIQRETILSTSVVHPNVVSVVSYPVSSAGGSHAKADCRQQRMCMMVKHATCIPQLHMHITTECISFACHTSVHICKILS